MPSPFDPACRLRSSYAYQILFNEVALFYR